MDDIYYYKEMISFLQMAMIVFHLYHYFQIEVAELKIALPISLEYAIYTDFFYQNDIQIPQSMDQTFLMVVWWSHVYRARLLSKTAAITKNGKIFK